MVCRRSTYVDFIRRSICAKFRDANRPTADFAGTHVHRELKAGHAYGNSHGANLTFFAQLMNLFISSKFQGNPDFGDLQFPAT